MGKVFRSYFYFFVLLQIFAGTSFADDSLLRINSIIDSHCIQCHGEAGKVKGKVNLKELQSANLLSSKPELLESLIGVIKDREMPPEEETPLSDSEREELLKWLEVKLSDSIKDQPFLPTQIRRMNRFQYNNSVVDLLELDRPIFRLNERLMRRRDNYFKPETRKMPPQVRISSLLIWLGSATL